MNVTLRYRGQVLKTTIPNPTIGQFVTLTAGDTRLRLYWDGKRFVLPQARVVDTSQIVAAAVEQEEALRDLPQWVYESRDPRIVTLREQSGPNYDAFIEARAAGAWQQGILYQQMRAERKARTGAGDDLEARIFAAYADHSANRKVPLPSQLELAELGGDWQPSGEDIKLALELKGEEEWAADRNSEDAEREDDWGFEKAERLDDPIGELMRWAGWTKGAALRQEMELASQAMDFFDTWCAVGVNLTFEYRAARDVLYSFDSPAKGILSHLRNWIAIGPLDEGNELQLLVREIEATLPAPSPEPGSEMAPLPTVLANIADQWATMSDKQRKLVRKLMPETAISEKVVWRQHGNRQVRVPVIHRRISTLWERSQMADVQDFIAEALDQWEDQRAANDELAHPEAGQLKVEVALDNQTRFLDWVARGALSATAEASDGFKADKAKKPWLARPTYLTVLDAALKGGANINQAKNRAYAADTLRLPDRVLAWTGTGFRVRLNGKGQEGVVSAEDARLVFPHLPAAAKARLKQVHGMVQ